MEAFVRTIKWLLEAWPFWSLLIIFAIHQTAVLSFPEYTETIHKSIALICQLVGGVSVLLSIDSNLGIIRKDNLIGVFIEYLQRFPLINSPKIRSGRAQLKVTTSTQADARVIKTPKTVEGKLEYLQEQIDELREKNRISQNELRKENEKRALKLQEVIGNIQNSISVLKNNLATVSVGGITLQVFGVLLVVYGSITGYML